MDKRSATKKKRDTRWFMDIHSDWIGGQCIGAIAWAIMQIDESEGPEQSTRLDELVKSFEREATRLNLRQHKGNVEKLPLSTLSICSSPQLQKRLPNEKNLLSEVREIEKRYRKPTVLERTDHYGNLTKLERCAPSEGAELIAQMVLLSDLPAESIVNALSFFVDDVFRKMQIKSEDLVRFQSLLDDLRNPRSNTTNSLKVINRIYGHLLSQSKKAEILKNTLLDALLFWPLLILDKHPSSKPHLKSAGSFSFPVIIDVEFDGKSTVNLWMNGKMPSKEYYQFRAQVGKTFKAAKQLWRSKNGFARRRWAEVSGASVRVDFRLASEICKPAGIDPLWRDKSAEAYFVQAFLARLIDRSVNLNVGVSGRLGLNLESKKREQSLKHLPNNFSITDDDESAAELFVATRKDMKRRGEFGLIDTGNLSNDCWMKEISKSGDKFRYAASSGKFRKLILHPNNAVGDNISKKLPYLEVNYARTISSAADAAQLGGWRPHRYFRCPDIGHLIHRDQTLLPRTSHQLVLKTRAAMRCSNDTVNRLGDEHSVLAVASILQSANFTERFDQNPTPSGLSWAFMRVEKDETNLRFWHAFLDILGASDLAKYEHFLRADNSFTSELIGSILTDGDLADQLGCHPPPDIVVLFSSSCATHAVATESEREVLPLDFESVLEMLSGDVQDTVRDPYDRMIGGSRIIVLDGDVKYQNRSYFNALVKECSVDYDLLRDLSIFDFGFTVQMAFTASKRSFCDMNHAKAELERYASEDIIWKFGQFYFVPHALRSNDAGQSYDEALRDKRIANSLMPGIGASVGGGFSPAECLQVEQVREAQRYLERAKNKAKSARATSEQHEEAKKAGELVRQIGVEQVLHSRFFEMPTWGVVNKLDRNSTAFSAFEVLAYAECLLENLLRKVREGDARILPTAYTLTVKCARKDMIAKFHQKDMKAVIDLKNRIDKYFDEAESLARLCQDPDERDAWLVHVLSWKVGYIKFSMKDSKHDGIKKLAGGYPDALVDDLVAELLELISRDTPLGIYPDARTLKLLADKNNDEKIAKVIYSATVRLVPKFYETYPRLFGVLDEDERRNFLSVGDGRRFWSDRIAEALDWANENKEKIDRFPPAIRERIQRGLDVMSKHRR